MLPDESEDIELLLIAALLAHAVEMAIEEDLAYLRLLAMAGCTEREARAALREDGRAN